MVEVVPYIPTNWYTELGAQKKLMQLENKGLPSFFSWRFLTLTIDPLKFSSEQSAYEHIKKRLRYFIRSLKSFLEVKELQYCWKLEFQENGMPHWHMLINYRKKIDVKALTNLWSFGRVDIKRITDRKLPYTFKYVSKSIDGIPSWFKNYNRPRLFQSSGIFPKKHPDPDWNVSVETEEDDAMDTSSSPETLGQRLKRYLNFVQFKKDGKYFQLFNAECEWVKSFEYLIKFPQVEFVTPFKLLCPAYLLTALTT